VMFQPLEVTTVVILKSVRLADLANVPQWHVWKTAIVADLLSATVADMARPKQLRRRVLISWRH
jgi:hypothetical protein